MTSSSSVVLVGVCGAVGSMVRFGLGLAAQSAGFSKLASTFAVNLIGSGLIALAAVWLRKNAISDSMHTILTAGALGGFTTYSAFNQETLTLFELGRHSAALAYVLGTLVCCFLAGWIVTRACS